METSAFLSGLFLLLSFAVRDLYFNTAYERAAAETANEPKNLDNNLDLEDDLMPSSRSIRKEKVERDDFFEDDDDLDGSFKFAAKADSKDALGGPGSRISSAKFSGPTLRFLYCTTSGYKNAYDQFVTIIQEKYPELIVEGSPYPPPNYKRIGSQMLTIFKFMVIGSILASQYSFMHFIGIPVGMTNWMAQNKVYAGLLCFFFCNFMETQLVATGAFEIYFDDVPLWSKLQTGRVPGPPELMQIIDNQLKMGGRGSGMDGFNF